MLTLLSFVSLPFMVMLRDGRGETVTVKRHHRVPDTRKRREIEHQ